MDRLLKISRVWGPLVTVVFTICYHFGVIQGRYEVSLSLIFLFVAAGAFVSGLRGGIVAAMWGSAYGWYVMIPSSRLAQTIVGMFALAALVGYGTRRLRLEIETSFKAKQLAAENRLKAEIFDGMTNGNIRIFQRYLKTLDDLRDGWDSIPDNAKLEMVNQARGGIADLITLGDGFKEMARQRGYVIGHDE